MTGFGKLIAFLVFASLLTFVVVHSAEIRRVAIAFFEAVRLPLFALMVDPKSMEQPPILVVVSKSVLVLLFQCPPPFSSL